MVHITKMMLKDFKSFGGLSKLSLQPGFNIITGANGSGKSSIIEAVRFVLGELGSRKMGVSDLSGLIFEDPREGGSGRAATAQVTIHFDNEDRRIAVDKKVVSVSRKIDRRGNGQYFLNGRRTPRRVILDLLAMAGISSGGFNIVRQGTATRLSDLTSVERMSSLEGLIGLTDYDEKKAGAKARLEEAQHKIEVASARFDEVRKRVNELEAQRNDAVRHRLLVDQERRLNALKISHRLLSIDAEVETLSGQLADAEAEGRRLDDERAKLARERDEARARLQRFSEGAAGREDSPVHALRSALLERVARKTALEERLRGVGRRRESLRKEAADKTSELEAARLEVEEERRRLAELVEEEGRVASEIAERRAKLLEMESTLRSMKAAAEANQRRIEELTESLLPQQESLSGLEIEISGKIVRSNSLKGKVEELEQRRGEYAEALDSLRRRHTETEALKAAEARRLEEMLVAVGEQVDRQRGLRTAIEGAGKLAKEAETMVTQFSAKRDLWQMLMTDEQASRRIQEMGLAGAVPGYLGVFVDLIRFDPRHQKGVFSSSNGWINALVFEDIETILDCVERLKKTRTGMTKFLSLRSIRPPAPLPDPEGEGVLGMIPRLIRCDERYTPIVNLIWGDALLVEDGATALSFAARGYRAVTLSGDIYEAAGGITGGYYQRPGDLRKLIPEEDAITALSVTIKTLRSRLSKRMGDLKLSGESLRKFNQFMDDSRTNVERIDAQLREIGEGIGRLERNIAAVEDRKGGLEAELAREHELVSTLKERRERTLQEVERAKEELAKLRELKPSDAAALDGQLDQAGRDVAELQERHSRLRAEIAILTNGVEGISKDIAEAEEQIGRWGEEATSLGLEAEAARKELEDAASEIARLENDLAEVAAEAEAMGRAAEEHERTIRQIERSLDQVEGGRVLNSQLKMELSLGLERLRLRQEQDVRELSELGFEERLSLDGLDLDDIERRLRQLRAERASLGAINQLAEAQYDEVVRSYRQMSDRINELEREKASILEFIEKVEREKIDHFMRAFNEICEVFSSTFARLTGGGEGRLELQKPEAPFEGGVDLYAQFPGKPMRLISSASGGERSVAAVAYLLAIRRFLKAPFYLFDEIDAHLDDLNASKLAEVLRENASGSQFIVVTLKAVMVNSGERVLGVVNPAGRSRVLTMPLRGEVPA